MKRKRIIGFSLVLALLLGVWFCITGYRRGRADFAEVAEGRPPIYATHFAGLLDGGTEWYRGRGYSVYRMHRILMAAGNNPPEGYLGGAQLKWWLPIRIFAADDDSYHYIPSTK